MKMVNEVFKTMLTGSRLHFLLSPQPPRGFLRRQSDMGISIPKTLVIPWSLACVADALNLLYTKGLDECVGRLQRRLLGAWDRLDAATHSLSLS